MGTSTNGTVKAVTYLRVSGESQVEGDGLNRQRAACAAYASKHGFDIVDEFRDEGVSGCLEPQYRPGLQALIGRLAMNGVRVILFEHPDRIGRDDEVSGAVRLALRKIGPDLRAIRVDNGQDVLSEDARLQNAIDDYNAHQERRKLVDRLARARARRREAGCRCDGRKPYGFRAGESRGVNRIHELVRENRMSFRKAAATLNAEMIPTRSGKPWQAGSVASVLKTTTSPLAVTLSSDGN